MVWCSAAAVVCATVAGCAVHGTPHAAPPPASPSVPAAPAGPVTLSGWKLTLPVAGRKGDAAIVDPAAATPPWLVPDGHGGVTLWAPVAGSTTPNSGHTRTELDSLDPFRAGTGRHVLAASVTVTQLPRERPDVIVGQIHGSDALSSVPFVLLYDDDGSVYAVVKQKRSGPDGDRVPLLTGVGLGTRFDFTISDDGHGSLDFTATAGGRTATGTAAVPPTFIGAPVRFQAGAYQQADSTGASGGPDDGARVTFHGLTVSS